MNWLGVSENDAAGRRMKISIGRILRTGCVDICVNIFTRESYEDSRDYARERIKTYIHEAYVHRACVVCTCVSNDNDRIGKRILAY